MTDTEELQTCTKDHPKPKGAPGHWEHMQTITIADWGDVQDVRCIVCGEQWEVEAAR